MTWRPDRITQGTALQSDATARQGVLEMADYLRQLASEGELHYLPNPGNAGDSMIACATYQLFEQEQIAYRVVDPSRFDSSGKIVLYGGGGGLVEGGLVARNFIEKHYQRAKRLVLLPHTVRGHEDLLGRLGPNVDLIARELVSYEHMKREAPNARVLLSHDLAFQLDVDALIAKPMPGWVGSISPKRRLRRRWFMTRELIRRRMFGANSLDCLREDKERTAEQLPVWNADISKLFKHGVDTPLKAAKASRMIFDQIVKYGELRTNRLHLAIAGALLGKRVFFQANNNAKCRSVYEFSMRDQFPEVVWVEG